LQLVVIEWSLQCKYISYLCSVDFEGLGVRWPGKLNDWRNILHTTTMGLWTFAQRPTSCSAHYRPGNNSN